MSYDAALDRSIIKQIAEGGRSGFGGHWIDTHVDLSDEEEAYLTRLADEAEARKPRPEPVRRKPVDPPANKVFSWGIVLECGHSYPISNPEDEEEAVKAWVEASKDQTLPCLDGEGHGYQRLTGEVVKR